MTVRSFPALKAEIARMCGALEEMGVPENAVFSSRVVAHELLTNALEYGGGEAVFSFLKEGDEITICVRAKRAFRPPEKAARAELYAERGRGLFLVDALSVRRDYSEEAGIIAVIAIE